MGAARGNVGEWAWHVHHEQLYEKLTEPLQKRLDYVNSSKFDDPTLRIKLMRVVEDQKAMGVLVNNISAAQLVLEKALDNTKKVGSTRKSSQADVDQANHEAENAFHDVVVAEEAIMDLHRKECEPDCPWNGLTILSGKVASKV